MSDVRVHGGGLFTVRGLPNWLDTARPAPGFSLGCFLAFALTPELSLVHLNAQTTTNVADPP